MPAQDQHLRAAGLGGPVQTARGGQVVTGRGADLADHQRAGIQPFLHRPQHVAGIARLDQQHPFRLQPPTGQGKRIGPAEIMGAMALRSHPDHGAHPVLRGQSAAQHADLEGQRRGRIEITRRADLMQARPERQRVPARRRGQGGGRFNRLDLASQLLELRPSPEDARRSWHVMAPVECSAYVPFRSAESQAGNRWGVGRVPAVYPNPLKPTQFVIPDGCPDASAIRAQIRDPDARRVSRLGDWPDSSSWSRDGGPGSLICAPPSRGIRQG